MRNRRVNCCGKIGRHQSEGEGLDARSQDWVVVQGREKGNLDLSLKRATYGVEDE